ncbi:Hypothetical predicted protein [Mytilus galloprovincialis]|uniref:Uncharacterized protein n=1 Tax=Mytilus galloprovincialis TaxID=29158 RepID=A0A8B6F1K4_MYTGA|nr:Hypothetical predicted protein [Mytilus galloprovincialis]
MGGQPHHLHNNILPENSTIQKRIEKTMEQINLMKIQKKNGAIELRTNFGRKITAQVCMPMTEPIGPAKYYQHSSRPATYPFPDCDKQYPSQMLSYKIYNLPFFLELCEKKYSKIEWKKRTKSAINGHWTNKLRLECEEKSTLQNLTISNLSIGVTHPVWATVSSSVSDIRKAITKSRMLTGTYLLQAHRHRFNQAEVTRFVNCRLRTKTYVHVITTCPLYMNIRIALYTPIKNFIVSIISESTWATHFSNREAICTLIVDCQSSQI